MSLSKGGIIIISMILASITMFILHLIGILRQKIKYTRGVKRTNYMRQMVDDDNVKFVLINMDEEPERVKDTENHIGLIIDGKLYTDKNSYFLQKDARIYIIGKKEDYLIAIMGGFIR